MAALASEKVHNFLHIAVNTITARALYSVNCNLLIFVEFA